MANKKHQVISSVVALSLTCSMLPQTASAAWISGPYRPNASSYSQSAAPQPAAAKQDVYINNSGDAASKEFIQYAQQGNVRIHIGKDVHLSVSGIAESGGTQQGRMQPVLFAANTEVIGAPGASLSFWAPMQLTGDNVLFKDITMKFVSSNGMNSVPHREIFLAGYGLTLDNVITDNPSSGHNIGGIGGSEGNPLPLVFAGGYKSDSSSIGSIGPHARLTVTNAKDNKTRFQAIYLSHSQNLALPPLVQAPIATEYTGPATLELDAKTQIMNGSDDKVQFPSGIFAENTTNGQIKFTGSGTILPSTQKYTLFGNENTTITLDHANLSSRTLLKNVGRVEVAPDTFFELDASSTVRDVVLNPGGTLKPLGEAKIQGNLTGGGTLHFFKPQDRPVGRLDIQGAVTNQTTVTQEQSLGIGPRITTNKGTPGDAFQMKHDRYALVSEERDGRLLWSVAPNIPAPVFDSVMFKDSTGKYQMKEIAVDLSKLQDGVDSTAFKAVCSAPANKYINPKDADYSVLLGNVLAVKSTYWAKKDSPDYDNHIDWAAEIFLQQDEKSSARDLFHVAVSSTHTQDEDYTLLFFKDDPNLPQSGNVAFSELKAAAQSEKLAGQLVVHLKAGTTDPQPPAPPSEVTFTLNADNNQPTFGDPVKFTFTSSDAKAAGKKVTLFSNGKQLAEQTVANGKAELTYNTGDRGLRPGKNTITAVYGDSAAAPAPGASSAETTVTVAPKQLTADMFQNIGAQTFNSQKQEPSVTPIDSGNFQNGDYTVSYRDNINVGTDTAVAVITAADNGYYSGAVEKAFTINKASYGNQTAQTSTKFGTKGSLDLTPYLCAGAQVGTVQIATDTQQVIDGKPAMAADGKTLSYQLKADASAHIGATAVISVPVTAPNYADYTISVTVTVADKQVQSGFRFASASVNKIYSDTDFTVAASGAAAGSTVTYQSSKKDVATVDPSSGKVTITGVGSTDITATAAPTADYAQATAVYTLKVDKSTVRITANNKSAYVGDATPVLGAKDYTVDGLRGGEALKKEPVLEYAVKPDMTKAGTVAINISGAEVAKDPCYNLVYVPGTLTIRQKPSSGGGNSGNDYTPPSKHETIHHPDGSTTTIVTRPDGSRVETTTEPNDDKTVIESRKDGTSTTTITNKAGDRIVTDYKRDGSSVTQSRMADGTSATTTVDRNGLLEAQVKLSNKAVTESVKHDRPVELPMPPVEVTRNTRNAPVVKVDTGSKAKVEVSVPVKWSTPGTVAVVVRKDGTEEVIRKSVSDRDGVTFSVSDDATIKIVDNSKSFVDTNGHWAQDAIDFATSHELYSGTSDMTFSPDQGMTRGMLAVVLHNLENNPQSYGYTSFGDVKGNAWYADSIRWAAEQGIVSGYGNGSFGPDDQISREQLAVMLWKYAGKPSSHTSLNFTDAALVSDFAQDAMKWAVENGIISGTGYHALSPKDTATRAQVAAMLMHFMEL